MFNRRLHPHLWLGSRRRCRLPAFHVLAVGANSPHAKTVMRRTESKFVRHFILQIFNVSREELDHLSALGTDHVIVMLMIVVVLVISLVIAKSNLAGESGLGEQL